MFVRRLRFLKVTILLLNASMEVQHSETKREQVSEPERESKRVESVENGGLDESKGKRSYSVLINT